MSSPAPLAVGWVRRWLALPALFTSLALLMVRPTRLDRLPDNLGDPALIVWIMSWAGKGLVSQPAHLFDAPMFWPHGSTFAYADVLATPAVPYWALYGATGSWTVSLIGVSLLFTVLAEVGAYAAALRITGRRDAAVVAAVAFAFSGYALGRWASLQLGSLGILALCLVAFLHLLDRPSARRGLLLGAAIALTFYASAYYGALLLLLLALLAPVILIVRLVRHDPSARRLLGGLAVAAALGGTLILPTALVSLRLQRDLHLERALAPEFDLVPRDLLRPTAGSYVWNRLDVPAPRASYEHRFFPGAIAALLGGVGVVAVGARLARRRPVGPDERPRAGRDLGVLAVAGLISLLLAKGSSGIGSVSPWKLVHAHLPGFGGIQATSRLAVPALLLGAVLASVGYAAATERLRSRRRLPMAALVLCTSLTLIDLSASRTWAPLDTSKERLAVYHALEARPAGAVLELPMPDPRVEPQTWAFQEAPRLLYSTLDWHPRVNGYSGFLPPGYTEDLEAYRQFPEPVAIERLRSRRVRYVILHVGLENGFPGLSEADATDRLRRLPPGASSTNEGASRLIDLGPGAGSW